MELFYLNTTPHSGQAVEIASEEANHIVKVLRYKIGDMIYFTDGKGNLITSELLKISKNTVTVKILNISYNEKEPIQKIFIIPLLRNPSRMEFMIEKLTELGVDKFYPYYSHYSILKRISKKERIQKILISALKQSNRFYLPEFSEVQSLEFILKNLNPENSIKLFGKLNGLDINSVKKEITPAIKNFIFLIGPEGDFTKDEINLIERKGFLGIKLGNNRLRSETAAISLISLFTLN